MAFGASTVPLMTFGAEYVVASLDPIALAAETLNVSAAALDSPLSVAA